MDLAHRRLNDMKRPPDAPAASSNKSRRGSSAAWRSVSDLAATRDQQHTPHAQEHAHKHTQKHTPAIEMAVEMAVEGIEVDIGDGWEGYGDADSTGDGDGDGAANIPLEGQWQGGSGDCRRDGQDDGDVEAVMQTAVLGASSPARLNLMEAVWEFFQ